MARLEAAWQAHLAPRAADAPTVISLFAGCGGSSLGYSMAGYRELLAVEWDDNAAATFRLNFPDVPLYHGDIAALSVEAVLERTGLQPGELTVLDGSPPCQGFSTLGKQALDDPRNGLFHEYVRLLRGLHPRALMMENVAGMVKGKLRLVFVEILRALKACGYQVSARVLNAMYFGVPQNRQRMIFVGVRSDLGVAPSHPLALLHPLSLRAICPDVRGSRSQDINPWMPATAPVCTIKKGSQRHMLLCDGGAMRAPTLAELRAFGSFPAGFQFLGTISQAWQRIGNSVPPLFMRAIAQHVRGLVA